MSNLKKFKDSKGNSMPYLYRDLDTNEFWALARVNDKVRKKSLGTTELLEAMGKLTLVVAELGAAVQSERLPNKLVKEYWEDLVKEKQSQEKSEDTIRRMQQIWKNSLSGYLENLRPEDIKPDMLVDFMAWHKRTRPGIQFFNVFKYFGNLVNHMHRVGAIRIDQKPLFVLPKSEVLHHAKKKGRVATVEEFQSLVKSSTTSRVRLIIKIAYYLGFRKSEIIEMEKARIVRDSGRYIFNLEADDTKTGLPREIPIPKHLEPDLVEQMNSSDSAFLFPSKDGARSVAPQLIDREWALAKSASGIVGRLRFHDLRGTCATNMAKQGINPIVAVTILGMSILMYQKKYLKLSAQDLIMTIDTMAHSKEVTP